MQRPAVAEGRDQLVRVRRLLADDHRADHHGFLRILRQPRRHRRRGNHAGPSPRAPPTRPVSTSPSTHAGMKNRRHALPAQPGRPIELTRIPHFRQRAEISPRPHPRARHRDLSPALPPDFRPGVRAIHQDHRSHPEPSSPLPSFSTRPRISPPRSASNAALLRLPALHSAR